MSTKLEPGGLQLRGTSSLDAGWRLHRRFAKQTRGVAQLACKVRKQCLAEDVTC